MKREGVPWATAAVLGLVATFGVSSTRTDAPRQTGGEHTTGNAEHPGSARTTKARLDGPCADLESLLQSFLVIEPEKIVAPDSCNLAKSQPKDASTFLDRSSHVHFVIAIVPDPLHTHFALGFDRFAEAIQEAAMDENYFYDSSWLPWETEAVSYVSMADQEAANQLKEDQEDQPGVLLFRRAFRNLPPERDPFAEGLAVLVVGEEPTGGLHRRQFENAVQWILALQPENQLGDAVPPIRILGPTFSGSIPSLVEVLQSQQIALATRAQPDLRIFSGSVTSNAAVGWLRGKADGELAALNIRFRSFQHSSNVDIDRYCRYAYANGTTPSTLAIVSEDETAFGAEYNPGHALQSPCRPQQSAPGSTDDQETAKPEDPLKKEGPVYLYYPRDIAALRAAYQTQSIFTKSAGQSSDGPARHTLQSDMADPEGKDHDTIRSYSGDQTAISQEAELQQMVTIMHAHNTQYIVLRSSNPLDQLFLSHYFRMAYPTARVVLAGSDVLLSRETGSSGLNGIMALSTYPLLPWEQDWTRPIHSGSQAIYSDTADGQFHSHRIFSNNSAEGTYIALRFLLHPMQKALDDVLGEKATAATRSADGADDRKVSFASPNAEGFDDGKVNFAPSNCEPMQFRLPDYAMPSWTAKPREAPCAHPPTWLSVLGDGGFWPIAAMDYPTDLGIEKPKGIPELNQAIPRRSRLRSSFRSMALSVGYLVTGHSIGTKPSVWPAMPPSMKLLMLTSLGWALFHALCCLQGSATGRPAHRAHFVRPNTVDASLTPDTIPALSSPDLQSRQRDYQGLLLLGSVLVVLVPIILAWGYGEMWEGGEPLPKPWLYRAFLPFTWMIAGIALCGNTWCGQFLFYPRVFPRNPRWWQKFKLRLGVIHTTMQMPAIFRAVRRSLLVYISATLILYWLLDFFLDGALNDANRVFTYWRAMHPTTGVSPVVPLLSLIVGFYGWFWCALQGLALLGEDRPQLPAGESLQLKLAGPDASSILRMFSRDATGQPLERLSSPFAPGVLRVAGASFVSLVLAGSWIFGFPPLRSLGSPEHAAVFCFGFAVSISLLLANAWQLCSLWIGLRELLHFLDRIPIRRTLSMFTGFSWGSVWKMGGSVLDSRYELTSRQLETLNHLRESLLQWEATRSPAEYYALLLPPPCGDALPSTGIGSICPWVAKLDQIANQRLLFAQWYAELWDNPRARYVPGIATLQHSLADLAGELIAQFLLPTWRKENKSLILSLGAKEEKDDKCAPTDLPSPIRDAEELVCLVYMAFVKNILGRMRSLVMGIMWIFISITVAIASYPFDPRPLLSSVVIGLFLLLSVTIIIVYSQMHRDATLSRMTNTTPGELGLEFWMKIIGLGVGPLLGVLASVFPEFSGSLSAWIQPGLASLK